MVQCVADRRLTEPGDMTPDDIPEPVLRFVRDRIDSVPHLEALLLLWSSADQDWTDEEIAHRIYVSRDSARTLLQDLARHQLIAPQPGGAIRYRYDPRWDESGELMGQVAQTYRRQLIRVATLIHEKASPAVRDFARAFDFKSK